MYNGKKCTLVCFIVVILLVAFVIPTTTSATVNDTVQPYASSYLDSYSAYVYLAGSGHVQVWFDIYGTGMMDDIGALSIEIHESTDGTNWNWVYTFNHDTTSGMLWHNDYYHSGHVTYNGVSGRYYKAYVCVWAGKDGSGDSRYFWTSVKPTISN